MKKNILIAIGTLISLTSYSFAQTTAENETPPMPLNVCKDLDSARRQANASWQFGKESFTPSKIGTKSPEPGCVNSIISVTPIYQEPAIKPYNTWTDAYDPAGPGLVQINYLGQNYQVRLSARVQQVKFYYASFKTPNGSVYKGWVEIPDQPAVVAFLEAQKKSARVAEQQTVRPLRKTSFSPDDGFYLKDNTAPAVPARIQPAVEQQPQTEPTNDSLAI